MKLSDRIAAAERIDDAADEPPEAEDSAAEPTDDAAATEPTADDADEPAPAPRPSRRTSGGKLAEVKRAARTRVLEELAPRLTRGESLDEKEMHGEITTLLDEVLSEWPEKVSTRDRKAVLRELVSDMLGYGPLDPLLADPTVTEVMVNAYDDVWVEREGKMFETDVAFNDEGQFRNVIDKIVAGVGRRIDESSPMVDARLPNGSRVNAIIPPLAIHGPVLTIRKFSEDPYTAQDLIGFGTLTMDMATVLRACVEGKLNVLVSGGTATGKTTLLNVLSSFIPEGDRIVTIEDAAELQLQQRHVISLESRPPNAEGKGEVTIRDLVRNALRMRPDRIVVGEVRGGEALDMLQAMNTGHEGSLTTVHANSARDALFRLEMLVMMAGYELPIRAIRENVAAALDLIVQLERLRDGTRVITSVQEIHGLEGDTIVLQELFSYTGELTDAGRQVGELRPTGLRPKFMERLQAEGVPVDPKMFRKPTVRSSGKGSSNRKKTASSRKKGRR